MSQSAKSSTENPSYHDTLKSGLPGKGETLVWTGLAGDSLPLAIANAVQKLEGLLVVITPDMQSAELLREQYGFFKAESDKPALIFPDWETLPYDNFSPHQDIISQRLSSLYQLPKLQRGLLIVSAPTVMQRLPPRDYIFKNSLALNTGQQLDPADMRLRLDSAGYRNVSQVMEHGEFAVRGSLLDR